MPVRERPPVPGSAELVANAALSLLNLACYLLDKQIAAQEKAFLRWAGLRSGSTACEVRDATVPD